MLIFNMGNPYIKMGRANWTTSSDSRKSPFWQEDLPVTVISYTRLEEMSLNGFCANGNHSFVWENAMLSFKMGNPYLEMGRAKLATLSDSRKMPFWQDCLPITVTSYARLEKMLLNEFCANGNHSFEWENAMLILSWEFPIWKWVGPSFGCNGRLRAIQAKWRWACWKAWS